MYGEEHSNGSCFIEKYIEEFQSIYVKATKSSFDGDNEPTREEIQFLQHAQFQRKRPILEETLMKFM